jgi:hypothetical protein
VANKSPVTGPKAAAANTPLPLLLPSPPPPLLPSARVTATVPSITAPTLAAFPTVSFSMRRTTAARNAKRQLVELIMVLEVTEVNASDLVDLREV